MRETRGLTICTTMEVGTREQRETRTSGESRTEVVTKEVLRKGLRCRPRGQGDTSDSESLGEGVVADKMEVEKVV